MNTTTPSIRLAYEVRLPLYIKLRLASLHPAISPEIRTLWRVAARYVRGSIDSPTYDLIARLQILEGVSGIIEPKPMVAGPWSRNPRAGLVEAQAFFKDTAIDPMWFSRANTGMISKVRGMVGQEINKWTKSREVHFDVDDIIQNGIMGLTRDGEQQLAKGPLFFQFGHFNQGIKRALPDGRINPKKVAGIVGKFFIQRVSDQFRATDLNRVNTTSPDGTNILDNHSQGVRDEMAIMADVLADAHNPLRKMIFDFIQERVGDGKWANIAMVFLEATANGEHIQKSQMAEANGMTSGTFTSLLSTKVYPALAAVKKNRQIQELLSDYVDAAQRRLASQHQSRKF